MKISLIKKVNSFNSIINREKFHHISRGFRAGIPIAIGFIPIAATFSLIVQSSGLPNIVAVLMSLFVFAGSSQFIAVNLISMGAHLLEIVMTTFIVNFRHFLMSSALSQRFDRDVSKRMLSLLAFGVTDETFAIASLEQGNINPWFMLGLNFAAFISWNFGTCVGIFLGDALPVILKDSLGIALYAMYIALLVPSLKDSKPVWFVSIISLVINSALYWMPMFLGVSMGWKIIISTVISALLGAAIFTEEV
ncbi:MAG: AzlC family ABC transporter permease [Clostridia bacterium]|nr:AzlC family ABC transporter permease [Clostridia bacterium]